MENPCLYSPHARFCFILFGYNNRWKYVLHARQECFADNHMVATTPEPVTKWDWDNMATIMQTFPNYFSVGKLLYFDSSSLNFVPFWFIKRYTSADSDSGLASNRRQATIWINYGQVLVKASDGLNDCRIRAYSNIPLTFHSYME